MSEHKITFTYLSQEDLLAAGCFDIRMAMETAEKTLLAFEEHRVLFPEKIVQIFDQASQDRINCLPATLLDEKICGVKWVSVFPRNPAKYDAQNPQALMRLVQQGVKLHAYPKDILEAAQKAAFELYEEEAAKNPDFARIYEPWKTFRNAELQWFKVAEASYANFLYYSR